MRPSSLTGWLATAALLASACGGGGAFDEAADRRDAAGVQVDQAAPSGEATAPAGQDAAASVEAAGGTTTDATVAGTGAPSGPTGTPSAGTSPSGTSGGGTSTSPGSSGTGQGSTTPPPAGLPAAPDHRGLTPETIKIGFVKLGSWQNIAANFGMVQIDWGDVDAQAKALVDWVNAHGGIDGRTVEYVIEEYKQEEASADIEAQICNRLADDVGVWAVVLQGQIHFSTRDCYANKGVLVLDPSPFSFDDDLYAANSPYLFSPSTPGLDRVVKALPAALDERGWFEPLASRSETTTALGIVHWDDAYAKRVLAEDLTPALEALGHEIVLTHAIDNSDAGTIQNGITNGIVRFRAAGINRVMFVGGNPIAPLWFLNAEQHGFNPRYGLTTFDGPGHTTDQTPNQMKDALGIGFNAVHDVRDAQWAFPSDNPTEQFCVKVMADAGQTFAARKNAEIGLAYCESLLLLQSGAKGLGNALSAQNWSTQVESLGSSFRAAVGFANSFAPSRHDGGRGYRLTELRPDCRCFHYVGNVRSFA